MTVRVDRHGLQMTAVPADFVEEQALPGTGVDSDAFWKGFSALVHDRGVRNRELLDERERLQNEIDAWHVARRGSPFDRDAYEAFLAEARNRVSGGDPTRHPEFELARWSALEMAPETRAAATVFTSGEHCPMCAAAHGWVGLGRIVYASSSEQLSMWLTEWGIAASPVCPLPIRDVVPGIAVEGPVASLVEPIRDLQRRFHGVN